MKIEPVKTLVQIVFALIVSACNSPRNPPVQADVQDAVANDLRFTPPTMASGDGSGVGAGAELKMAEERAVAPAEKKIIKSGSISVEVDSVQLLRRSVDSLVTRYGAYYANEQFSNDHSRSAFILSIRIPQKNYEIFISALESGPGKVVNKSISADDVTDQFIDLEARLKTKREFIARYHELLRKAADVKSMLEIQEGIRVLQEEIESSEGQLKYLSNQVSYSSLEVTLFRTKPYVAEPVKLPGFVQRVKNALVDSVEFLVHMIVFLISVWPLFLLFFIVVFIFRRRKKRILEQRQGQGRGTV